MSSKQQTTSVLLDLFSSGAHKLYSPLIILSFIYRYEIAGYNEIYEELDRISNRDWTERAFKQSLGRLEKTFGLIYTVEKAHLSGKNKHSYRLTEKGKEVLLRAIEEVILPLQNAIDLEG